MSAPIAQAPAPAPVSPARPAAPGKPAWQRNRVFRFFSSVKLAVVLLSVLILASIAGTLYETTFDAKVARAYIYDAWWFNLWLVLLCTNLACAAFSRMPWKRHHTGFLLTHLGIITLLIGAMIGRKWGIEGTMTLFKGQPPNNQLVVDQRVLRVEEGGTQIRPFPVSIIGRRPSAEHPWTLGVTPAGWKVELTDYAPLLAADFAPQPVPGGMGGQPAVHVRLVSKRLGQTMDNWLLAGDPEHGTLDLGLASVILRPGTAPTPDAPAAGAAPASAGTAVDESIIAFALKGGEQVGRPAPGTAASGARIRLAADASKRQVSVDWRGATWDFDAVAEAGKEEDLSGSGLFIRIENYWPDFVLKDGQPVSASQDPKNPAVLVRVHGKLPPPADDGPGLPGTNPPASATAAGSPGAENQVTIYCDEQGGLTFLLKSSASPEPIRGTLTPGQAINTGWADWQLDASQAMPQAVAQTTFHKLKEQGDGAAPADGATPVDPATPGAPAGGAMMQGGDHAEGVRVRLSHEGRSLEEWVASGWSVTLPTTPSATRLAYDFQVEPLPIGLQLTNFEVQFNEGTADPASFKSSILVTDVRGNTGNGACSMNHPFNYPGHWWNTFSGLTFKMSQASWNPDNLSQSVIQILRDPGWILKWIGSIFIVSGIFTLFYLRPGPNLAPRRK